jgi:hypothetical protein
LGGKPMMLSEHPNCKQIYFVIDRDGEAVMMVQTDLAIDGTAKGYDAEAVASLIDAAAEQMKSNPAIARVRFEEVR